MRIGLIAPPYLPVPPVGYGGTEAVVENLARGLTELGHEVRLFTVGESTSAHATDHFFDEPVAPIGDRVAEAMQVAAAYDALDDVDLIHDHTVLGPFFAQRSGSKTPPVVTTVHGVFTPVLRRFYTLVGRSASIIAISQDQAGRAGSVPISAVIHHGVDLDAHRFGPGGGDYLVFIGRMSADKGVDTAIRVARVAGLPLRLVCKMREAEEVDYFHTVIEPMLGPDVQIDFEMPLTERVELIRHAHALLDPIAWPEPFGLVMAESLACGTPVVAYPAGAAPEIVTDGATGFLCRGIVDAARAVRRVVDLSREVCRRDAEQRFSLRRMAEDHERLYRQTLDGAPAVPAPRAEARREGLAVQAPTGQVSPLEAPALLP